MKIRNFIFVPLMALALSSCGGGGSSIAEESFVSGNGSVSYIKPSDRIAAPALSGMTLSGKNYTFKVGQVAVVNVWASWCAPCRAEAPTLAALSEKYTDVAVHGNSYA
jgi:thiol-disulfide isomerase/thioredoxin